MCYINTKAKTQITAVKTASLLTNLISIIDTGSHKVLLYSKFVFIWNVITLTTICIFHPNASAPLNCFPKQNSTLDNVKHMTNTKLSSKVIH